ncbi:MAG: type III PLP-dependent enzyme [Acidimicrobiales bacterium]
MTIHDGDRPLNAIRFLDADHGRTPVLALDLTVVATRYRELTEAIPDARVLYAMKANPHPAVVGLLAGLGCGIDVASTNEVDEAIAQGVPPERISYGNTVRRASEISHAVEAGVRMFAVDDHDELDKLLEHAPGSTVLARLNAEGTGAAWPLSRKFGTDVTSATEMLQRSRRAGHAVGATFHVGSQQSDPTSWDDALSQVAQVLDGISRTGDGPTADEPFVVNLGGGLPSRLADPTPALEHFSEEIHAAIARHLAGAPISFAIEPGRFLVADAGVIETEVIGIVQRPGQACTRWVFVDVGVFQGLSEAAGETIRYPLTTTVVGPTEPTVVAGPTCDSTDILYERRPVQLPSALTSGDRIRLHGTGAYTVGCSTLGFNGFEPLRVEIANPDAATSITPA